MLLWLTNMGFAATATGGGSPPVSGDTYGVHYGKSVSTGNELHDSRTRGVGFAAVTGKETIRE